MTVKRLVDNVSSYTKEESNYFDATQSHLNNIGKTYSKAFITQLNIKPVSKKEHVSNSQHVSENQQTTKFFIEKPDKNLFSASIFIDNFSNKIYQLIKESQSNTIRLLRNINNSGVELSVVGKDNFNITEIVNNLFEEIGITKSQFKIVTISES
jgi:hypothetical protein